MTQDSLSDEPPDHELGRGLGDDERGIYVFNGYPMATGGGEIGLAARELVRIVGVEPKRHGR